MPHCILGKPTAQSKYNYLFMYLIIRQKKHYTPWIMDHPCIFQERRTTFGNAMTFIKCILCKVCGKHRHNLSKGKHCIQIYTSLHMHIFIYLWKCHAYSSYLGTDLSISRDEPLDTGSTYLYISEIRNVPQIRNVPHTVPTQVADQLLTYVGRGASLDTGRSMCQLRLPQFIITEEGKANVLKMAKYFHSQTIFILQYQKTKNP